MCCSNSIWPLQDGVIFKVHLSSSFVVIALMFYSSNYAQYLVLACVSCQVMVKLCQNIDCKRLKSVESSKPLNRAHGWLAGVYFLTSFFQVDINIMAVGKDVELS